MRMLPPLASLRAFEAAARHLRFRSAAEELGVTPTAISHQIHLLEASLGLPLFRRGVRQVSLTSAGEALYPVLRDGFDAFAQAIAAIKKPARRAISLSATTAFTARWLVPRVDSFRQQFPQLDLRLHASEQLVDLIGGEADAAIRYGAGPFPGLVAEPLICEYFTPLCSPSLAISTLNDLRDAPLLHSEWYRRSADMPSWPRWSARAGLEGVDWSRGITFTDERHVIQAAIAGKGVALLSPLLVADELATGALVQPFDIILEGHHYHFVHAPNPRYPADLAALRSWLGEALGG